MTTIIVTLIICLTAWSISYDWANFWDDENRRKHGEEDKKDSEP